MMVHLQKNNLWERSNRLPGTVGENMSCLSKVKSIEKKKKYSKARAYVINM